MPRKNRDEYNEYMRAYMTRKKKMTVAKLQSDDFDGSALDGKEPFDLNSVNKVTGAMREAFGKKGDASTEEDPILKNIEKYAKYIPLVLQFFEGFKAAAKDSGMFTNQQQKQDMSPQPPAGWLGMSPMQKLNFKYTRPEWYEAGLRYDEFVQTGQINPAVNISHVDATYDDAAARRREQMAQRQRMASGDDGSNPRSLSELSKKYPEAPLVSDAPPMQTSNSDGADAPQERPIAKEKTESEAVNKSDSAAVEKGLIQELQADNAKYISMGVNYLNNLPMNKFKEYINDVDSLIVKAKPFIPLIPIQMKGMLQNTPASQIEEIAKVQCPEKYEWLKKNKKIPKLLELFEKIKKEILV